MERLVEAELPGRFELRRRTRCATAPTRPDAVDWLLERLPAPGGYVVVASILADKDVDGILERLARAGEHAGRDPVVERPRPCRPRTIAARARRWFASVEAVDDPRARSRARASSAGPCSSPARSISLPTSPTNGEMHTMTRRGERISVFLFALAMLAIFVGAAFAAGYALGRMLL